jgi:branched-chain amino acid transport system ATP-binding protein
MNLLEMNRITKSFGGLRAINRVDLTLQKGQIVGLIGPNGAGKTTLFNIISGVYKPEGDGRIFFKEKNIKGLKPHEICKLGIARTFQTPKPFKSLTVIENVAVGGFSKTADSGEVKKETLKVLKFVGLESRKDEYPYNLTLADQKKIELSRALATSPDLLLLDEVISGLNPRETEDMIQLLRKVREQGISILIIEHVMQAIMNLSDWIFILHHGNKLAEGTPKQVSTDERVIKAYLGEEYVSS